MARVRLGDIVSMPLPDQFTPDYVSPALPPLIPALPADLAAAFYSSMQQGDILQNQGPPYASSDEFPPISSLVAGGPTFVATQPGGGLPLVQGGAPGARLNPFFRTPIIPDSALPPVLRRSGLLNGRPIYEFNEWDRELLRESRFWEWVRAHGGIKSCCRIPELGAPVWSYPPFQVMPSNGLPFREIFFLPTNAVSGGGPFNALDTVLGQFRCEIGYDGAITHFICGFTGDGFDDGSGSIVWRLKIGQRYAKTLGNVTFTFGSLQTALTVPGSSYRFSSGQNVQLIANIPAGSPVNGGRLFAGVIGWTYPRR